MLSTAVAKATANALLDHVVVVGHAARPFAWPKSPPEDLRHDFHLLGRKTLRHMTRDTAFSPLLRAGLEKPLSGLPSLKLLASCWLDRNLHRGAHSSVEDARAAMLLYRILAPQWELFDRRRYGAPSWTAFTRRQGARRRTLRRLKMCCAGWKSAPLLGRLLFRRWHSGVRCFEVLNGPPVGVASDEDRCLGYVYVPWQPLLGH